MPSIYNQIDKNIRSFWVLLFMFTAVVFLISYLICYVFDSYKPIYYAISFCVICLFASDRWGDKIIIKLSNGKKIEHNSNPQLYHIVENLCITAGLPMPEIYIIEDGAPNAFATGRNPKNASIVVTSGLLQKLEEAEIEGVVAHELSQIGNQDIRYVNLMVLISMIFTIPLIIISGAWLRFKQKRTTDNFMHFFDTIKLTFLFVIFLPIPIFAFIMQLAISREREFSADFNGVLLTRYPEGLAKALEKISSDSETLKSFNYATSRLYIVSPFKEKYENKNWFFRKLFMTHPPIEDRIKALRGMSI